MATITNYNRQPTTHAMRLFIVTGDSQKIWQPVNVLRITWHLNSKPSLIVQEYLSYSQYLKDFPSGCNLELVWGINRDPSDYSEGQPMVQLTNCQIRRRWMPHPVATNEDYPLSMCAVIEGDSVELDIPLVTQNM